MVGLSGGVDSVVLLHLLCQFAPKFSWQLTALHVHHGISPNADSWAEFCAVLCARLGIPLHIERVDIAPMRAHGLEAAARHLRHTAFAGQPCDFVALAHHLDDQVETFFLQLLRGAGVRGASAMPVLSKKAEESVLSKVEGSLFSANSGAHQIVRPLLHSTRKEIVEYANMHGLQWIEDESNADDAFPRNFLRHRLLPLLGEKFPAYRDTLTRSTRHFAEAGELLDDLARMDAPNLFTASGGRGGDLCLEVARLQSLSLPRAKNLLRYFLHHAGAPMPQSAQLDEMLLQLCAARKDAAVCVSFSGWQLRRYRRRVYVLRAQGDFERNLELPWQGEKQLNWQASGSRITFERQTGQGISQARLQCAPVTLRLRRGGESLRPSSNAARRTLKNLLQEQGIPPWQRDRLPLLYCGDELVWVAGVAIAADYQCSETEAGVVLQLTAL